MDFHYWERIWQRAVLIATLLNQIYLLIELATNVSTATPLTTMQQKSRITPLPIIPPIVLNVMTLMGLAGILGI